MRDLLVFILALTITFAVLSLASRHKCASTGGSFSLKAGCLHHNGAGQWR